MKLAKAFWLAAVFAVAACNGSSDTDKTAEIIDEVLDDATPVASCPPEGATACSGETEQSGTDCVYTGSDAVTITGTAQDFQTDRALSGAVVNVMDNDTGKPTGICGITNGSGQVSIKVPKDKKVGIATVYTGAKDTYQFNLEYAEDSDEVFFSVSSITAQLIPGLIGTTPDETKGTVAGTVYNKYVSATTEADVDLLVRSKAGQEAYYFGDDGLPTNLEKQATLNPENALYVIFELEPGAQELELLYDGEVTDVTDNKLFVFPDSVSISNITCTNCEE